MPSTLSSYAGSRISSTISFLVVLSHGLFFYAQLCGLPTECGPLPPYGPGPCSQTVPLDPGGLMRADLTAHVEYDAGGLLAPGLQALTNEMCYSKGIYTECPEGRHTPIDINDTSAALCSVLECGGLDYKDALLHVSYFYSVSKLWMQPVDAGPPVPPVIPPAVLHPNYVYPGRPAAGMLFFWSFLWPHTKLLLLHAFFYLRLRSPVRRNGNYWFAFFGKWSLADVLVMAAVLALFNLDVDMPLVELWDSLKTDFLPLCDVMCLTSFNASVSTIDFTNASAPLPVSNCSAACHVAQVALEAGISPSTLPNSQIHINLKVEGLAAMYAFCAAVIISLSTGVWVETLDDKLRDEAVGPKATAATPTLSAFGSGAVVNGGPGSLGSALLPSSADTAHASGRGMVGNGRVGVARSLTSDACGDACGDSHSALARRSARWNELHRGRLSTARGRCIERLLRAMHVLMVLVQLVTIIGAFTLPAFERRVTGGVACLLEEMGIDFTTRVSLISIPALVARGGGLDMMMAGTFALFILIAPVLRSLSLLALLVLPMRRSTARWVHINSRRIVAYTALDVMLIATPLIGVAFGPVSEALLNPQTLPLCGTLDLIYRGPPNNVKTCMRIDVLPDTGYWFNVAAIVMMLLSGFDGSPTSKFIHRRLYPFDADPPPSLKCDE